MQSQPGIPAQNTFGPYRGRLGGYANLYTGLAIVAALAGLFFAWSDVWLLLHHRRPGGVSQGLARNAVVQALAASTLCLSAAAVYSNMRRNLDLLIAEGGPDADRLDRTRLQLSVFAFNLSFFAAVLWWSGVISTQL